MAISLQRGQRVTLSKVDAFADGVAVKQVRPTSSSCLAEQTLLSNCRVKQTAEVSVSLWSLSGRAEQTTSTETEPFLLQYLLDLCRWGSSCSIFCGIWSGPQDLSFCHTWYRPPCP